MADAVTYDVLAAAGALAPQTRPSRDNLESVRLLPAYLGDSLEGGS